MNVLTFYFGLSFFFVAFEREKMVEVWQHLEWRIFIMTIICMKGVDDKFGVSGFTTKITILGYQFFLRDWRKSYEANGGAPRA